MSENIQQGQDYQSLAATSSKSQQDKMNQRNEAFRNRKKEQDLEREKEMERERIKRQEQDKVKEKERAKDRERREREREKEKKEKEREREREVSSRPLEEIPQSESMIGQQAKDTNSVATKVDSPDGRLPLEGVAEKQSPDNNTITEGKEEIDSGKVQHTPSQPMTHDSTTDSLLLQPYTR
jgi:hypothetical protein